VEWTVVLPLDTDTIHTATRATWSADFSPQGALVLSNPFVTSRMRTKVRAPRSSFVETTTGQRPLAVSEMTGRGELRILTGARPAGVEEQR